MSMWKPNLSEEYRRNRKGQILKELSNYIDELELQAEKAKQQVEEWSKDEEIQVLEEKLKASYEERRHGFCPSVEEWNKIQKWEEKHTAKMHQKEMDAAKKKYGHTKRVFGAPDFEYRFGYWQLGTLGIVVCKECEKKAYAKAHGKQDEFRHIMDEWNAEFSIGEV